MKHLSSVLLFIFILLSTLIFFVAERFADGKREGIQEKHLGIFQSQYSALYRSYDKLSDLLYHEMIDDSAALSIFAEASETDDPQKLENIRERLYLELAPTYQRLKNYNLRQLHFHTRDNHSFLRFHKPGRFGDDLSAIRVSVVLANQTKKRIKGFEEGRIFNGFRYVYPLFYHGKHIGSMESSLSFHAIKSDIEKSLQSHVKFMIKKEIVDHKLFDAQKPFYTPSDLSPDYYYESKETQSVNLKAFTPELIHAINGIISEKAVERIKSKNPFALDAEVNGHSYIISFLPVSNFQQDKAAAYLIGYVRSDVLSSLQRDYRLIAAILIFLNAVIFTFLYTLIKRDREIKEQKKRFEAMFNEHSTVMLLINPEESGTITNANSAATRYYGYSLDELTQMHFHDLCVESSNEVGAAYQKMCERSEQIFAFTQSLKDQTQTDVEVHATLFPFQEQTFAYLIIHDITEKNAQKNELAELNHLLDSRYRDELAERRKVETYFSEITKNTFDAILSVDESGNVLTWNKACEQILGFSEDEMLGHNLYKTLPTSPLTESFQETFDHLNSTHKNAFSGRVLEITACHRKGHEVPLEVSVNLIQISGRHHAIGIIRDLTEKKATEKERLQREKLLVQQSKMAEMGNMINAIIHQWKQPLNTIMLLTQSLQDLAEDEEEITPDDENFHHIIQQVEFMSRTMNDFRNYFRPSKEKKPFSVLESIDNLLTMMKKHYESSGVKVTTEGDPHLQAIGYDNEFKQVILNIVNNARDAFVEQKRKDGTVIITLLQAEKEIHITLQDNAGGIPQELLPDRLFEPYISTKGDAGTGIGLSMSKTIIEDSMNGHLSVHNTDEGACFHIRLPADT